MEHETWSMEQWFLIKKQNEEETRKLIGSTGNY
ncbi:MAG: hypothetical protein US63_C0021G0003 [Candidatus Moranbacteria bacterium GW2011_GWC2_37_8]|nr:MAG: hypothetical protein US63_C0021G0003 [Candidatus Moranbacteria bacterium GW2011_GWC2_37_8]KKQ61354.1 MAG: hypothetical protein US82_C0022G0003 [Parcubacteria group bacterium GW2011_GWC1_38_22]